LGNENGAYRIETDESVPGNTEINGRVTSYGIIGTNDYDILEGTTNQVVAVDVNTRLNYLYVATRSDDGNDENAVTYINLEDNSYDGAVAENRLLHRLIDYINFKDE
jgi:hypothetical protein